MWFIMVILSRQFLHIFRFIAIIILWGCVYWRWDAYSLTKNKKTRWVSKQKSRKINKYAIIFFLVFVPIWLSSIVCMLPVRSRTSKLISSYATISPPEDPPYSDTAYLFCCSILFQMDYHELCLSLVLLVQEYN